MRKVISRQEAAALVQDGMTLGMLGFVTLSVPEELLVSLEERFLAEGHPKGSERVLHLRHRRRRGTWRQPPGPRGAGAAYGGRPCRSGSQAQPSDHGQPDRDLLRPSGGAGSYVPGHGAGHKCGVITHVGLKTFCDPEVEACCFNDAARKAHTEGRGIVQSIEDRRPPAAPLQADAPDVCFIKATYGDSRGNLSMEKEGLFLEQLEMALATKNNGGTVIAQVDTLVEDNTLDPAA